MSVNIKDLPMSLQNVKTLADTEKCLKHLGITPEPLEMLDSTDMALGFGMPIGFEGKGESIRLLYIIAQNHALELDGLQRWQVEAITYRPSVILGDGRIGKLYGIYVYRDEDKEDDVVVQIEGQSIHIPFNKLTLAGDRMLIEKDHRIPLKNTESKSHVKNNL